MDVPATHVLDDEGMPGVRAHAIDALLTFAAKTAEIERMTPLAVGFVVLEADERQGADIDFLLAAVGLTNVKSGVEFRGLHHLESIAVLIAFAGDVACE